MSIVSNIATGNFAYLCRLCLDNNEEEMGEIFSLAVKVELVTRLNVAEGDGLPSFICSHCKLELDSASDFINRCTNNDSLLRSQHYATHPEPLIAVKQENLEVDIEDYYEQNNNDEGNEYQDINLTYNCGYVFQEISPSDPEPDSNNFAEKFSVVNITEPQEYFFESENSNDNEIAAANVEENAFADIPSFEQQPRFKMIKMYTCHLCDESFNMKSYLHSHMKCHDGYFPAESDIGGRLADTEILARYQCENIDSKPASAKRVPNMKRVVEKVKGAKKTKELKLHHANKSPEKKTSTDTETKVMSSNKKKLAEKKSAKPSFPCASCDKVFSNNKAMLEHRICHGTKLSKESLPWAKKKVVGRVNVVPGQSRASPTKQTKPEHVNKPPVKTGSPSSSRGVRRAVKPLNKRKLAEVKSKKATFPCTTCDRVFTSNKSMLIHRTCHRTKLVKKMFSCTTCDKVFSNNKSLLIHKMSHRTARTKTATFSCTTCSKAFATNEILLIHASCHATKFAAKSFPCGSCSKMFTTKKEMLIHSKQHIKERVHKCPNCSKRFAYKTSLKIHAKVHAKPGVFKCGQCGEEFGNRQHLYHHKRFHAEEKPYKCAECNEDFVDEVNLLHHFKVHANKPVFTCVTCGEEFDQEDALEEHAKSHIAQPKKNLGSDCGDAVWPCNKCGREFTKKASLTIHLKSHKISKCLKCGEEFDTKSLLTTHMKFHKEDNPYKCGVCDNEFANEVAMFDHFKCHACK